MKNILTIVIILSSLGVIRGQNIDEIISKEPVNCNIIAPNSALYFTKYINEGNSDSTELVLNYWEGKCGDSEPVTRAKVIWALKNNRYNDALWGYKMLQNLTRYEMRMEIINGARYAGQYDSNPSFYGFIRPGHDFDREIIKLAKELKSAYHPESIEYLIAEFYTTGNITALYSKIQSDKYRGSLLHTEYYEAVETLTAYPESHSAVALGMWIPTGKMSLLGIHPEVGFMFGYKFNKINYDFRADVRFMNSKNEYLIQPKNRDEEKIHTKHFLGATIGIDVGYDIYRRRNTEIQLIGGVGADLLEVLPESDDNKSVSIGTYNFNIGVNYKFYITNFFYIGLKARYNFVDYTIGNKIDFTGNPITVSITIGALNDRLKRADMDYLGVKRRYK